MNNRTRQRWALRRLTRNNPSHACRRLLQSHACRRLLQRHTCRRLLQSHTCRRLLQSHTCRRLLQSHTCGSLIRYDQTCGRQHRYNQSRTRGCCNLRMDRCIGEILQLDMSTVPIVIERHNSGCSQFVVGQEFYTISTTRKVFSM